MTVYYSPTRDIISDSTNQEYSMNMTDLRGLQPGVITWKPNNIGSFPPRLPQQTEVFVPDSHEEVWKYPEEDLSSFKKIKQSGLIKMSAYSVGKRLTTYHPVVEGEEKSFVPSWWIIPEPKYTYPTGSSLTARKLIPGYVFEGVWGVGGSRRNAKPFDILIPHAEIRYRDNTITFVQPVANVDLRVDPNLENTIESIKSDVSTALHKRWDLMTDILEGRQTLTMAKSLLSAVRKPIKTMRDELKPLQRKGQRISSADASARSKWLGFRYGIMPTLYSLDDLKNLLTESRYTYLTERTRVNITLENEPVPDRECIYVKHVGTIKVNGTAKARFSSPLERLTGGTSLNVINSLWEVIPYSLVVDWVSNMGDWLYNQSSLLDPSYDVKMCYSVKREITTLTYARRKDPSGALQDHLIKKEVTHSYVRVPFTQNDIKLIWNAKFSSYKRWIDAYALSVGPLTKALRRLTL